MNTQEIIKACRNEINDYVNMLVDASIDDFGYQGSYVDIWMSTLETTLYDLERFINENRNGKNDKWAMVMVKEYLQ